MTTEEEQQRLRLELAALSTDLAKGLQGLTFMVNANRDAIDTFRGWMQAVEQDDHMFTRLDRLETALGNLEDVTARIAVLEQIATGKEGDQGEVPSGIPQVAKAETRVRGSQWKIYLAFAVLALPGLVALLMKLMEI